MVTALNVSPKKIASNISYLPFGGITGLTFGNGLFLTQGYDNQYRISSILTGSILNLAFGYDANGNIISILDSVNPPGGEVLETPGAYSYQQGTSKLAHIEGTPPIDYGYDANGNITTENTWTYIYDLSNQLVTVLNNSNQVAEYTYNGAGQRIKKVTQTETRIFHYDLMGHLIAETNQSGQMLAEYVYLGDQLLSMIKPGESVYYFHNDHLGTPKILTSDSQAIAWKAVYTPFGEAVPSIQTVENPFRFPGQYYDSETGLHYNYFRYYNPQTGRYITPDPIGLEGGINLFAYTKNPTNFIDPLGLFEWSWKGARKGLVNVGIGVGVGILAVALLPEEIVVGLAAAGALGLGLITGQVITGNDLSGKELSDCQRSQLAVEAVGGWASLGVGAIKTKTYQYYPSNNPNYTTDWYVRGFSPPYSPGQEARGALNLPSYNRGDAVRIVDYPWYKPITGPRPVEGGTGWEYYKGWHFPSKTTNPK